jgi:hypothetical protein
MNKTERFALRITKAQKMSLCKKANEIGQRPSEFVRNQIINLIDYGTGLPNSNRNRKG